MLFTVLLVVLSSMSGIKKTLCLSDKVKLIQAATGKSCRALAEEWKIGKTQVSGILKRKAEILEEYETATNLTSKRRCQSVPEHNDLDAVMFTWFSRLRSLNVPVTGPMIQTKAIAVAREMGIDDFKASSGWLTRFKARHSIQAMKMTGERASVPEKEVDEWLERLPTLLEGYEPRDIYNVDETGLFYRALPDKTLSVKGQDVAGGKKAKERITACLCVNMLGEFEKTLVIGKAERPRCMRNIKLSSLPVTWAHNKKAWMTTTIFEEWLQTFNKRMHARGRKVALLLDNAPSHPKDLRLSNVKIIFLPANTTSVLQPLDQGVIACVKKQYQKRLLDHIVGQADTDKDLLQLSRSVDVLMAINWLRSAISQVKPHTVERCFQRCGVTSVSELTDIPPEEDDDDISLEELIQKVQVELNFPDPLAADDFVNIDCPAHDPTDEHWEANLVKDANDAPADDEDDEDDVAFVEPAMTATDFVQQLGRMKRFCTENGMDASTDLILRLMEASSKELRQMRMRETVQTKITSFFKRA